MATFAVGDIQGCYDDLRRLLDRIKFDPGEDTLWITGDLVARGPGSLETLRFVRKLKDSVISILGNHDLNLLAVSEGFHQDNPRDALRPVLDAPDAAELLTWLRHRPFAHHDPQLGFLMVHAGLPPQWNLATALACAREAEQALRGPDYREMLEHMYGNEPAAWDSSLKGVPRLRFIVNALTRMRFVTADGKLDFIHKGAPGSQPPHLLPWFRAPDRRNADLDIICGHWSTLGNPDTPHVWALDTGCVWGGTLTALRLDDEESQWVSIECKKKL